MVAIVSGSSLGVSLTSLATLGQRGLIGTSGEGQNGEQAYVNVASGNLVLQDYDDRFMVTGGMEADALRTYNSQGQMDDDNADNWSTGTYLQHGNLQYSGTLNTANSTVTRTDADGAQAVYAWDAA